MEKEAQNKIKKCQKKLRIKIEKTTKKMCKIKIKIVKLKREKERRVKELNKNDRT